MMIKCQKETEAMLLAYLQKEAVYNTFMTADILNYGFEQEFQEIYAQTEGEIMRLNTIRGIYLKFFENLMIYSRTAELDEPFLKDYFTTWSPAVIMGKAAVISKVSRLLPDYIYNEKNIYTVDGQRLNRRSALEITVRQAGIEDADRIYEFLMSIDEIKGLYGSKDMIINRIKTGDGVHCLVEKDGVIIGHANSTADNPHTVMIGGVATQAEERYQGIATAVVHALAEDILAQGKTPCLFGKEAEEHNLFVQLGFKKFGAWATLERPVTV